MFITSFFQQVCINSYLVGFLFQFSKQTVIENYVSFIENFPRAEKVLDEISTKSSFQKYIEVGLSTKYL